MNAETYSYLWENALEKAIQDVLAEISDETQKKFNFSYQNNIEEKKEKILEEYNNQRLIVREKFFDTGSDGCNLIDIHKVCACFTSAILKVRVFEYDRKMAIPMEIFYSNYTLAFLTGIHIMYLCMLSDYRVKEDKTLFNLLKEQTTLVFPDTNEGHDKYVQGRIKTLALNDIYNVDFDILTYADMLYWIEKYNKDCLNEKANKIKQK